MNVEKVKELLKKVKKWVADEGGLVCPHKFGICKHDNENCPLFCLDQALSLLDGQPPAGELVKWLRQIFGGLNPHTKVIEACDLIESLVAEKKELEEEIERLQRRRPLNCKGAG